MAFHLGWIDFSKEERDKALDILRLLQDPGDAFADAFFPGTSTLLTRAKYFVVVPYIIQEKIEECGRSSLTARQTLEAINKEERRFGERMLEKHKGDRTVGIVGSTALSQGRWVRRSPSELYWNGIRTLGICKSKGLSLLQYVSAGLESCRARGRTLGTFKRGEADEGDDLDAGGMLGFKPLDIGTIHKKGWMKDADISLTYDEAAYLREKILSNVGGSVFAVALENNVDLREYGGNFIAFAEDMSKHVDVRTRQLLELACYFSRFLNLHVISRGLCMRDASDITSCYRAIEAMKRVSAGMHSFEKASRRNRGWKRSWRLCKFRGRPSSTIQRQDFFSSWRWISMDETGRGWMH